MDSIQFTIKQKILHSIIVLLLLNLCWELLILLTELFNEAVGRIDTIFICRSLTSGVLIGNSRNFVLQIGHLFER